MRKVISLILPLLLITTLSAVFAWPAAAQDDPPGRVARLNYAEGSVSYQVSGDTDWVQADTNRPLTTGDNLWSDKDSRGEVHIGSTAIRLSSETGISFLTLDDRTVQIQLAEGQIEVHLRHLQPGDAFEIDTPNLSFTLTQAGEYVISTDPTGQLTSITDREGEGQVTGGGESWNLSAGQLYTFNGTDQIAYNASPAPAFDDFENWCQSRDQRENGSTSAQYVSRDVDGYYDLDDYGTWDQDSDYGEVWVPNGVADGWAPYQMGEWVYMAPWGWTWVDAEPWGFAPFHYGRWAFVGARWAWVPGPVVVRPVYAPALVGFVGGAGFGASVSFGGGSAGVGWFPLGPRDVFIPAYQASPRYVQNINITNTRVINVTQVNNVYTSVVVNRDAAHVNYMYAGNARAVTAVSRDTFVNARPVSGAAIHVTAAQIQSARVVNAAPIAPTQASYVSATARIASAKPATPIAQRPVVVRLNPAVSNVHQRENVYTNDSPAFNRPPAPNGNSGAQSQSRNGFRPFGSASNSQQTNQSKSLSNARASQPQYQQRSAIKFTPPVKAHDDMYDVHPPLNNRAPQQPKQQAPKQSHSESTPRVQSNHK